MVKETIRVYARLKPLGRRQQAGVRGGAGGDTAGGDTAGGARGGGWKASPGPRRRPPAGQRGELRGREGGDRATGLFPAALASEYHRQVQKLWNVFVRLGGGLPREVFWCVIEFTRLDVVLKEGNK